MSRVLDHSIRVTEQSDGWEVSQDRRVLIDRLDHDEAIDYVERRRKPDESVVLVRKDGREQDITRDLRINRRRGRV